MPHFANDAQQYYLSTNLKVMYTSLVHQPALRPATTHELLLLTYARQLPFFHTHPHLMLVRNPYDRLLSFYKDKFKQAPLIFIYSYYQLQDCQKIFCPYIAINRNDSCKTIKDKLLDVTFADFMRFLPKVYRLDDHLRLQVDKVWLQWRGKPICKLHFDRVLKMESEEDLAYLQTKLSGDLSHKHNSTEKIELENPWSSPLFATANEIYKRDFETFHYEVRTW